MTSIMIFDTVTTIMFHCTESNKFYRRINNVRNAPRNNENGHLNVCEIGALFIRLTTPR